MKGMSWAWARQTRSHVGFLVLKAGRPGCQRHLTPASAEILAQAPVSIQRSLQRFMSSVSILSVLLCGSRFSKTGGKSPVRIWCFCSMESHGEGIKTVPVLQQFYRIRSSPRSAGLFVFREEMPCQDASKAWPLAARRRMAPECFYHCASSLITVMTTNLLNFWPLPTS